MRPALSSIVFTTVVAWNVAAQAEPTENAEAPSRVGQPSAASMRTAPLGEGGKDEARQRFKRGVDLYEEQDYRGAVVEFRAAYDMAPSYKLLYSIGQSCYQLQDYVCALQSLEQYLDKGRLDISHDRKTQVEGDLKVLRSRVGKLRITVDEPGAQVFVDDVAVGTTPLAEHVLANVGRRKISVTKEGRLAITEFIEVPGATVTDFLRKLAEIKGRDRTFIIERDRPSKMTTLSWVGIGAAGALAGGAVIAAVVGHNASTDLATTRYFGETPTDDISSKQSNVKRWALASGILTGAAVLTIGTTLALTYTRQTREAPPGPQAKVRLRLGLGQVGVDGTF